jgi:hypothetical protein
MIKQIVPDFGPKHNIFKKPRCRIDRWAESL